MTRLLLVLIGFILFSVSANGQTIQSSGAGTGNWNDAASWIPNTVPTSANSTSIIINSGHTINYDAAVTGGVDQVTVSGTLSINSGITMTLANGTGNEITVNPTGILTINGTLAFTVSAPFRTVLVNGTMNNSGSLTNVLTSKLTFGSGSNYFHQFANGGTIPAATWNLNSTMSVVGFTSGNQTTPSGLGQTFGHFVWNSPGQDMPIALGGFPSNINGDFRIVSTGSEALYYSNTAIPGNTMNIGGNFDISGGTLVWTSGNTSSSVINISGNMSVVDASTDSFFQFADDQNLTVNVTGNFTVSGTNSFVEFSVGVGTADLNVQGNFTFSGGDIFVDGGVGSVNFIGASTKIFTSTLVPSGNVNYSVASLSTLTVANSNFVGGGGAFTLNGTLQVGSTDSGGALQTGTAAGNIRVSGTRTYASNSSIVYNGSGAQFIGNGFPSGSDVNLTINNSSGVTLSSSLAIVALRVLTLTSGNISIGAQTLTINGSVTGSGGIVGGATSNLTIGGTGTFGTLTFNGTNQLLNFTLNRTSSGLVTLGGDLTIVGTFTQTDGDLDLNGHALTLSGAFARTTGDLLVNSASSLTVDGSGTLPSDVGLSGTTLGTLTLNRAAATLTTSSSLDITNLNLTSGIFGNGSGIGITAGGTITRRASGSMLMSPNNTTNAYNVTYNNSSSATTGPELPSNNTALSNLTKSGSGSVTLNSAITVNGILTLSSGSFNAGSNSISLKGNMVANASSTLTSSTITFSGNTTISGSAAPVFGPVSISGTLLPSVNVQYNGTLGVTSTGVLNAGSTTSTFGGTTPITVASGGSAAFNNIVINTSSSLTAPSTALNAASITNSGTFTGSSATLTVSGSITNSGTFSSSTNVSASSLTNSTGTFTAPSGSLTLTGDLTNNATFAHNNGTVVFSGTSSILGSTIPSLKNITISGILNGPATLNLAGNFVNNGTFNRGTGTVVFNGSATQSISGSAVTDFNNISVTNTAGPPAVQVQSNQNLRGVLTLASNSIFDADGSVGTAVFTVKSTGDDPTVDAAIATIPSGASVTGNVTVQRYMSIEGASGGRIYRYISSPVQNPAVSQIQPEIPITGPFTGSSVCSGCGTSQSMFMYNETVITGDLNTGYVNFPVAANTEQLTTGRGYAIFIRGNVAPISTAGSALWDVRAPINSGTISYNGFVSFTSSGTLANDGWNLVGNPYPSTIDWDAVGWTRTGINNAIYMKDNGLASPVYATYVGGVGANGGSRFIPIGQAFLVKSDGGPINFQATENVKVGGTQTTFFREGAISDILRIALRQGSISDESVIRFSDEATSAFDQQSDAYKIKNPTTFNLSSTTSDGSKLVINSLPKLGCTTTIPMDISDVLPGKYSLDFSQLESFSQDVGITLVDDFLGGSIDIRLNASYEFEVTNDSKSFGNRFKISIAQSPVKVDLLMKSSDVCAGTNSKVTIANSQSGVSYYASTQGQQVSDIFLGNGDDLSLSIDGTKISVGQNNIVIMALGSGCDPVQMKQNLSINVDGLYSISSVQGGKNCREGQLTLSAEGTPANGTYNWYESQGATTSVEGQHGAQFSTPTLIKTKTYFVSAVNSLGCEGGRVPVVAEIVNYDDAVITIDGKKLISNYETGNQWYLDGDPITDATGKVLEVQKSGLYKLEVAINGCTTSANEIMAVTGVEKPVYSDHLQVYPNPTDGIIDVVIDSKNKVIVNLISPLGVNMDSKELSESNGRMRAQFDISRNSSGVYILQIQDGEAVSFKKVIKK
jgi:hypothetical protein